MIDAAEALNAGWLELWYQPKFNTHTLELCGTEALIRVRHPTWGIVEPAYFLPDQDDPYLRVLSDFVIGRTIDDWRTFITNTATSRSHQPADHLFSGPGIGREAVAPNAGSPGVRRTNR